MRKFLHENQEMWPTLPMNGSLHYPSSTFKFACKHEKFHNPHLNTKMRSFTIVLLASCLVALATVEGCLVYDGTCPKDAPCCDSLIGEGKCVPDPKIGEDCIGFCNCAPGAFCNHSTMKCEANWPEQL